MKYPKVMIGGNLLMGYQNYAKYEHAFRFLGGTVATEPSKPTRERKKPTGRKPGRPRKKPQVEAPEPTPEKEFSESLADDVGFDFSALIDVLVPPSTIEIVDAFGNEHKLVSAVPARSQIQIFRIAEELQKSDAVAEVIKNGLGDGTGSIAGALMYLGADPHVMSCLAEAFEVAHPLAFAQACESAAELGIDVEDAADCFAVEELVSAIVPLFLRLVKRTAQAASVMQVAQAQTN